MFSEKEKTKFLQSENKWPKPLVLQSGMVTVREISVRDELIVVENIQGLNNRLGSLLLPHSLTRQMRERIERNKNFPVSVLFDSEGRVHQLVLGGKYFLMMMDVWKNVYVLKHVETTIEEFDRETCTLKTIFINATRFQLPRECLGDLEGWTPQGIYRIEYDDEGRVFRIYQPSQYFGGPETNLPVGLRWDTRFFSDPFSLLTQPKPLKRIPHIIHRREEATEEIIIEEKNDCGMMII